MAMRKQPRAAAILTVLVLCTMASAVWIQGGGQTQIPAAGRGCNLPEPFPCPVARILDLTVGPAAINPGESARITWRAENPTNITLSPGVGRVESRGTIRVSPSATTTYTLRTEGGPNGGVVTRTVTLVVRGTQPVAVANTTGPRPIPRMPDGKPDLQGVWFGGAFGLNVRRGGAAATASLPTRPIPKPGLESRLKIVNDPYEVGAGCGVRSVPVYFGPGYRFQIVQTSTTVVQLIERMHLHRIFQIGAEHSADVMNGEQLTFLGDSVANWDGDTLVVDTLGFNQKTAVGTDEGAFTGGFRHSPKLHLVERIRRIDYDTLEIESTLEDSDLFTGPWRLVTRHERRPEYSRVPEYMCEQSPDFYKPLLEGLPPIPPVGDLPALPVNGRGGTAQPTPNR